MKTVKYQLCRRVSSQIFNLVYSIFEQILDFHYSFPILFNEEKSTSSAAYLYSTFQRSDYIKKEGFIKALYFLFGKFLPNEVLKIVTKVSKPPGPHIVRLLESLRCVYIQYYDTSSQYLAPGPTQLFPATQPPYASLSHKK